MNDANKQSNISYLEIVRDLIEKQHLLETATSKAQQLITALNELNLSCELAKSKSIRSLTNSLEEIQPLIEHCKATISSSLSLKALISVKHALTDAIRLILKDIANSACAMDWQSPSISHSVFPQAGKFVGQIFDKQYDYKRDRNLDCLALEKAFLHTFLPLEHARFTPTTLGFNSGMGAIATILTYLLAEYPHYSDRPVLIAKNSYFENHLVCRGLFNKRMIELETLDVEYIMQQVYAVKPLFIFIDSICNSKELACCNISELIDRLAFEYCHDLFLIVDTTCSATSTHGFPAHLANAPHLHVCCIESLAKYYQFGLDMVTGGVAYCSSMTGSFDRLNLYREYLGTNITDASAHCIPVDDAENSSFSLRTLLAERINRMRRNTEVLTNRLAKGIAVDSHNFKATKIISHFLRQGEGDSKYSEPRAALINLELKSDYRDHNACIALSKKIIACAKEHSFPLIHGTSFGFDVTRVYPWTTTSNGGAYLRIAPGTECLSEVEELADIFIEALHE